jgi:hypothetical protein
MNRIIQNEYNSNDFYYYCIREFSIDVRFYEFIVELDGNKNYTKYKTINKLCTLYEIVNKFIDEDEFLSKTYCEIWRIDDTTVTIYLRCSDYDIEKFTDRLENGSNNTVKIPYKLREGIANNMDYESCYLNASVELAGYGT